MPSLKAVLSLPIRLYVFSASSGIQDLIDAGLQYWLQDSVLWIHMILMGFAFGIIFPTGMVLGVRLAPYSYSYDHDSRNGLFSPNS